MLSFLLRNCLSGEEIRMWQCEELLYVYLQPCRCAQSPGERVDGKTFLHSKRRKLISTQTYLDAKNLVYK